MAKYPRIFKTPRGGIIIIYRNRVEEYAYTRTFTKSDIDKTNPDVHYDYENIYGKGWNASHEVVVMQMNNFKEVHARGE
jgi:hypothetical protein